MKLAIDAVGASTGGNITILNNILYYLTQIDQQIQIVIYIEETSLQKFFIYKNKNIEIKNIKNKTLIQKIVWQQFGLHQKVKKEKGDLILSITNIGSFFPKLPQIVYFHQSLLFISNKELFNFFDLSYIVRFKILKLFVVLGFLKAKAVIVQTNSIKQKVIKQFPSIENKIYRIYSGIPKVFEYQASNWKVPIKLKNEFKILYIAHPAEYKNFNILFETAKLAKEKNIQFTFLLTLDKISENLRYQNFIEEYRQIISQYQIETYIYFIGSLKNNAEIKEAYLFADIVIHPSLVESFPQTLTEAMLYEKPLLSADLPYAREIAGDASLYFNPRNPYDLLDAIIKYMKDKKLFLDMSLSSKERVAFFDSMKRWAELYNIIRLVEK